MTRRSHTFDHMLGKPMASSLDMPERRKSAAELRRMDIADQLIYLRNHPESDDEKLQALMREERDAQSDLTGEVDHQDLLDNRPPEDWGR